MQLTVAQLIAQLQQFDSNLPVEYFAHNSNAQLQLHCVEFEEEFVDSVDNIPASVALHFNV